jgi:hypothetical protein
MIAPNGFNLDEIRKALKNKKKNMKKTIKELDASLLAALDELVTLKFLAKSTTWYGAGSAYWTLV